jgi:hypothetical protein
MQVRTKHQQEDRLTPDVSDSLHNYGTFTRAKRYTFPQLLITLVATMAIEIPKYRYEVSIIIIRRLLIKKNNPSTHPAGW